MLSCCKKIIVLQRETGRKTQKKRQQLVKGEFYGAHKEMCSFTECGQSIDLSRNLHCRPVCVCRGHLKGMVHPKDDNLSSFIIIIKEV